MYHCIQTLTIEQFSLQSLLILFSSLFSDLCLRTSVLSHCFGHQFELVDVNNSWTSVIFSHTHLSVMGPLPIYTWRFGLGGFACSRSARQWRRPQKIEMRKHLFFVTICLFRNVIGSLSTNSSCGCLDGFATGWVKALACQLLAIIANLLFLIQISNTAKK